MLRFALNETSPQNHLVFFETDVESVRSQWNGKQTHMLHGLYANIDGQTVFYDEVAPITYLSNANTIQISCHNRGFSPCRPCFVAASKSARLLMPTIIWPTERERNLARCRT